jgi:flavodoxin
VKKLKVLILYSSYTGNTEKVAHRMKEAFEKDNHETDIYKINKNIDPDNPPFNYKDHGFLCVGSPVRMGEAAEELVKMMMRHRGGIKGKIIPGPKKGTVFATYGGAHLGPKEAKAALAMLESCIEHLEFKCVGRFSCPGKVVDYATPEWFHGDIRDRPNAADLDNAEKFIRRILKNV